MLRTISLLLLCLVVAGCGSDPGVARDQHLKRGDDYVAAKKLNEAIIEYRNALRLDPQSGDAHLKVADAYLQNGDIKNAFGEFVRAADLMPASVDAQLKAGQVLLLAGLFEDAKSRADRILAADPKNIQGQILRGNALAGLKDIDGAVAQVESAIQIDPSQSLSYSSLGALLQFAKGDTAQAEAAFKKAVEIDPKSVQARLALANLYWSTGRREEAEKAFKETLEIEPRNLCRTASWLCSTCPPDASPRPRRRSRSSPKRRLARKGGSRSPTTTRHPSAYLRPRRSSERLRRQRKAARPPSCGWRRCG